MRQTIRPGISHCPVATRTFHSRIGISLSRTTRLGLRPQRYSFCPTQTSPSLCGRFWCLLITYQKPQEMNIRATKALAAMAAISMSSMFCGGEFLVEVLVRKRILDKWVRCGEISVAFVRYFQLGKGKCQCICIWKNEWNCLNCGVHIESLYSF